MFWAALLSGFLLSVVGFVIWRFKLVELLAGYKSEEVKDPVQLAKVSGVSLLVLGGILILEALVLRFTPLSAKVGMLIVLATLIVGITVVGILTNRCSRA